MAIIEKMAKEEEGLSATERVSLNFYFDGYRFLDEFMLIPGLSEPVIIGAATLQKWRMKLDFEADEVIMDPRVTRLRLLRCVQSQGQCGNNHEPNFDLARRSAGFVAGASWTA